MSYDKETNKQYLKDRYEQQRNEFINYLGGECVHCGSTDNLQFDHINPQEKEFGIAKLWPIQSLPSVYIELDKCQLLCEDCHKIKTKADFKSGAIYTPDFTHGTIYAWMHKKCKCEVCEASKAKFQIEKNQKRSDGKYNLLAEHGTYKTYKRGCSCVRCRSANTIRARIFKETGIRIPTDEVLA